MDIREVLVVVNQMRDDGVISNYALGGAIAANYYLEPFTTLDIDIFVELHAAPGSLLITLEPILHYLRERGFRMEGEYLMIGRWPVQFLPPGNPLIDEALKEAIEVLISDVRKTESES
jgi:hypothetical protein